MTSLADRLSRFARSPQARRLADRAQRYARDPRTRRKLEELRSRLRQKH